MDSKLKNEFLNELKCSYDFEEKFRTTKRN